MKNWFISIDTPSKFELDLKLWRLPARNQTSDNLSSQYRVVLEPLPSYLSQYNQIMAASSYKEVESYLRNQLSPDNFMQVHFNGLHNQIVCKFEDLDSQRKFKDTLLQRDLVLEFASSTDPNARGSIKVQINERGERIQTQRRKWV